MGTSYSRGMDREGLIDVALPIPTLRLDERPLPERVTLDTSLRVEHPTVLAEVERFRQYPNGARPGLRLRGDLALLPAGLGTDLDLDHVLSHLTTARAVDLRHTVNRVRRVTLRLAVVNVPLSDSLTGDRGVRESVVHG